MSWFADTVEREKSSAEKIHGKALEAKAALVLGAEGKNG
jgi:hypothetical protein